MALGSLLGPVFSLLGSGIRSFFGLKQSKVALISQTIEAVNKANLSSGEREAAIASVIVSANSAESWLTRTW